MPASRKTHDAETAAALEWSLEAERGAFSSIPDIDTAAARELLPEVVQVCELIGNTESLHWLWVCVSLATITCQLSPRDTLELCPSIEVPGALWTALLHPGSVNTSGLLKVLNSAMEMLYDHCTAEEAAQAAKAHKERCAELQEDARSKGKDPDAVKLPALECILDMQRKRPQKSERERKSSRES